MPLAPKIPASASRLPLLALALASFGIGTTEFVIIGLLPDVAGDLGVTIPQAGLLVTGYALSVAYAICSTPITGPDTISSSQRQPRAIALSASNCRGFAKPA